MTEQQKPVAFRLYKNGELYALKHEKDDRGLHYTWEPLYTSPPASKPWVELTDDDKYHIAKIVGITEDDDGWVVSQLFTLIEAKLKEKNK